MPRYGFVRVAAVSPQVYVGDPERNAKTIRHAFGECGDADLVAFPELCLTGYTVADLLGQDDLLEAASRGLSSAVKATKKQKGILIVGLPLRVSGSLYNVAAVLSGGRVYGFVPKQYLPTYNEFYEARWFRAATGDEPKTVEWHGESIPFGIDLLFNLGVAKLGIEICEDLWVPTPPSGFMSVAGAELLVNLSASTELIDKATWRKQLVQNQSGRCIAGYVYAGAGPSESTTDVVFGSHCLIAENGTVLSESRRVGDGGSPWKDSTMAVADVDIDRLRHDRQVTGSFSQSRPRLPFEYREISIEVADRDWSQLRRTVSGTPFVPAGTEKIDERCAEIFGIQAAGLAKRVGRLPNEQPLVIGVSGGLDSTLALLAAVRTANAHGWPRQRILGIIMPGFGTTEQSLAQGTQLVKSLGIRWESVDIRPLCLQAFQALNHQPLGIPLTGEMTLEALQVALMQLPDGQRHDLIFENVQARIRTFILMSRGFVLGTGDMSEQALGWSTYNGDHMSMYNVNTSVPKTLVRFLVRYAADHHFDGEIRDVLHRIAAAPITPELLPPSADGKVVQRTEEQIGPYELHDFFLYHMIRCGFGHEKIRFLAGQAVFSRVYSSEEIAQTLQTFYRRFFANQYKRSCVPDGPKVGTVSLSPRGDWRMPSDAEPDAWL